jgi:hypothetical protein
MPLYDGLMVSESLALNRRRYLRANTIATHMITGTGPASKTGAGGLKSGNESDSPAYGDADSHGGGSGDTAFTDLSLMYSMTSLSLTNHSADTVCLLVC